MSDESITTRQESLRTALAVNRGMELLSHITRDAETTVEHDETKRVSYLTDLFIRIHTDMFQDWKQQNASRPGEMPDGAAREAVRNAMLNVLCANGGTKEKPPEGLFDSNGYVIYHEQEHVAQVLAKFYEQVRDIKPFGYGNDLTLDFFMVALGKLPAFQEVYPAGIDLRRLDDADKQALHQPGNVRGVEEAFKHAMDPSRTPPLKNVANGYGKWEKHVEYVSGIQFLSHVKDRETYLVTANGGLVPLKEIKPLLEKHLKSDELLSDFKGIKPEMVQGYLPETEELRARGKTHIDGIKVGEGQPAPLVCLETNILTGLRSPAHNALIGMIAQCRPKGTPLFSLANNPDLKHDLKQVAGDEKRRHMVDVAYERLSAVTDKLNAEKARIFEGKERDVNPKLIVSMGGAGAGKSSVKKMFQAQCGNNFVEASLDEFRKKSDIYKVLIAANHHGDDYITIEPFANTLRQWVADGARDVDPKKPGFYNVLYDGTGVVYKTRYSDVVNDFKKLNYHTQVAAVDTPMFTAVERVDSRAKKDNRALPWIVVTGKHTRTPKSFVQAVEDTQLNKVTLFANDGKENHEFLVAESFTMSHRDVKQLREHQQAGTLAEHLKSWATHKEDSTLKVLASGEGARSIEEMLALNPKFDEKNVAFIVYPGVEQNRVLLVYNSERYVELLNKGSMNPHASFKEGLMHTPATVPYNITQRVSDILKGVDRPSGGSGLPPL